MSSTEQLENAPLALSLLKRMRTFSKLPGDEWRLIRKAEGYRFTFEDQRRTGATPGKLLRHGRASS